MAIPLTEHDESLAGLASHQLSSTRDAGVRYAFERLLGTGSMGFAYLGTRISPQGTTPVVLKLLRPHFVMNSGGTGRLIVKKEVEALSRLKQRVPPTPFVVQLVDAGAIAVSQNGKTFELPWLALEYVHGGEQGTTLVERLVYSVENTGHAFDRLRAAHAVECIAQGLDAVHDEGVIHRDITPNNVLCCGFGEEEIFKICDFGLARPVGITGTFGGIVVGTVGYAPPEQGGLVDREIGPWSDVFTFAVDTYFMLTGQSYFPTSTVGAWLSAIKGTERKSIRDSALLNPELASDSEACDAIDRALSWATAARPGERPASAGLFASSITPALRPSGRRVAAVERRMESVSPSHRLPTRYQWTLRYRSKGLWVVRSAAWDGDGRCLAATSEGVSFWDGSEWRRADSGQLPDPLGIRFVHRRGAGRFIVGGDGATLATFTTDGVRDVVHGPSPSEVFVAADGDFDDLAVMVGERPEGPPVLYTLIARRWLKPLPIAKAKTVSGLARLADDRWLLCGRGSDGRGFLAEVSPLAWDVVEHPTPQVRALVACAAREERQLGLAVGSEGLVVRIDAGGVRPEILPGAPDLSAATLDLTGREWVAAGRRIWLRSEGEQFQTVWEDDGLVAPIVSLFAEAERVIALTADGSVLEGTA